MDNTDSRAKFVIQWNTVWTPRLFKSTNIYDMSLFLQKTTVY